MNSFELTMALLRSALWGEDVPKEDWSEGWWEEIYEVSRSQGVHTLIFDAFRPECVPPRMLLAKWVVDIERTEAGSRKVNAVQKELSGILDRAGIRHTVLKGSAIARLYPRPEHRPCGDIDLFFPDADGFDRALSIAKRIGDPEADSDGDIHYFCKGVVIEHHRSWNHLSSRVASGMEAGLSNVELCPEDTLLMLYGHILRHSLVGGAGLRQLTDLAVATRRLYGKYDMEAFRQRMDGLKLGKWGMLMAAVLNDCLGVPEIELPFQADRTQLSAFMDLVFRDGDLGKENEGFFKSFIPRTRLFLKLTPGEFFARWASLSKGRIRKTLGIGRK